MRGLWFCRERSRKREVGREKREERRAKREVCNER